jgi:choice-of-anchor B domain-containing protein
MKKITFILIALVAGQLSAQTNCTGGFAGVYPCNNVNLMARVDFPAMGGNQPGVEGSSCWGWTDPLDGKEYAIMGCSTHTAFVDITNPAAPVYKGKLNSTNNIESPWREMKVYNNYAFIVSEAPGHGMQVFDLTRLRNVTTPQVFTVDALYTDFGNCHTITINEAKGFAYCNGSNTFGGGPHIVDITNPESPVFAGGYADASYSHDSQVITYNGPDTDHTGKEIFIGANEDRVVFIDVSDPANATPISEFFYSETSYTHQGWTTPDQRYWILGDEIDELDFGFNSRSVIIDMTDLDNPVWKNDYFGPTPAIDHNGFVLNDKFYLSNYTAGLRIISTTDIDNGNLTEQGYFDTFPTNNNASFNGAWSVYPYFPSGSIIISDINRGLFIVRKGSALDLPEFTGDDTLKIFPNPAVNFANISADGLIETVAVFDVLGKKVKEFKIVPASDFTFETNDLEPGMYLVKVNNTVVRKMIKQ